MFARNLTNRMKATLRLLTLGAVACCFCTVVWAGDAFGYSATASVTYSYLELSGTGTSALANTDDGTITLALPFGLQFYGTTYGSLCVSTNGLITFGGCPTDDVTPRDLTAQSTPGNLPVIAPFWMDLSFAAQGAGSVYYQTQGPPGSRQFVIEWNNVHALNGPDALNFEVVLTEGSNTILFQYKTVDSSDPAVNLGAGATVGIAASNAPSNNYRTQWSNLAAVLKDNSAILFTPPALAAPVDVSSSVSVTSSAFVLNRLTKLYSGTIKVTNTSPASLSGPLTIVLTNLTPGVTATNAIGSLAGQGPFFTLQASGTSLAPGQSATVSTQFTDPANVKITFSVKTYSGNF